MPCSPKLGADDAAAARHSQPGPCYSSAAAADVHARHIACHSLGVCLCKAGAVKHSTGPSWAQYRTQCGTLQKSAMLGLQSDNVTLMVDIPQVSVMEQCQENTAISSYLWRHVRRRHRHPQVLHRRISTLANLTLCWATLNSQLPGSRHTLSICLSTGANRNHSAHYLPTTETANRKDDATIEGRHHQQQQTRGNNRAATRNQVSAPTPAHTGPPYKPRGLLGVVALLGAMPGVVMFSLCFARFSASAAAAAAAAVSRCCVAAAISALMAAAAAASLRRFSSLEEWDSCGGTAQQQRWGRHV